MTTTDNLPLRILFAFLLTALCFTEPVSAQKLTFGGTRTNFVAAGDTGFIVQPPHKARHGRKPVVWYAPTIGKYPNINTAWLLERLVKKGFWVCGVDVGESWGSPAGRKVYSAFYDTLMTRYHLDSKVCLIPQSRGGLMLYCWAQEPGNAVKVSRIAGIYPICDFVSSMGIERAAKAWNMDPAELKVHAAEHNPIDRLQTLKDAGVKIFHIHGDADKAVPLDKNSRVLIDRYKAMGGDATLVVIPGKGHAEIPEYFHNKAIFKFLLAELKEKR
jgi:hypothetical protein